MNTIPLDVLIELRAAAELLLAESQTRSGRLTSGERRTATAIGAATFHINAAVKSIKVEVTL